MQERRISPEYLPGQTYKERIMAEYGHLRIWEYLSYNPEGNLCIDGVPIIDVVNTEFKNQRTGEKQKIGTPIELVYPKLVETRIKDWNKMVAVAKNKTQYKGGTNFAFATKAAPMGEIVAAVLNSGCKTIETSSVLDLMEVEWLDKNGYWPKDAEIICNGYKPSRDQMNYEESEGYCPRVNIVVDQEVTENGEASHAGEIFPAYLDKIIEMKKKGYKITPIADSLSEIEKLAASGINMEVGLRFKAYDVTKYKGNFDALPSRHGMDWKTILEAVDLFNKNPQLKLTTFHAMVGAAPTVEIPIDEHVKSLAQAAEYFFKLRTKISTLKRFNTGGGIPSIGLGFDHQNFLEKFFTAMQKTAQKFGDKNHYDVDFELGSLPVDEAEIAVTRIIDTKVNHTETDGTTVPWGIQDYSLMTGIPDQLMTGKRFIFLAANRANNKAVTHYIGDLTCDHDGKAKKDPKKKSDKQDAILVPVGTDGTGKGTLMVILAIQAYQEMLAGAGGAHHCQEAEANDVIMYKKGDNVHLIIQEWQTAKETMKTLGFVKPIVGAIRNRR